MRKPARFGIQPVSRVTKIIVNDKEISDKIIKVESDLTVEVYTE